MKAKKALKKLTKVEALLSIVADRYAASAEYRQVKAGKVGVEGGWRIYSSGPGLYTGILVCDVLGIRRRWGKRAVHPLLPTVLNNVTVELDTEF